MYWAKLMYRPDRPPNPALNRIRRFMASCSRASVTAAGYLGSLGYKETARVPLSAATSQPA